MQNNALMKSTSSDNVSKLYGYLQKIAQPFFDQFASFKPASAVIPLSVSRRTACNAIFEEIQKRAPGLKISATPPNDFTISCKVNAKRKSWLYHSIRAIKLTTDNRHQGRQEELQLRLGSLRCRPSQQGIRLLSHAHHSHSRLSRHSSPGRDGD